MELKKKTIEYLPAHKLRAIASGQYKGIKSSYNEKMMAKIELKNRGLPINLRKKVSRRQPQSFGMFPRFGGF